MSTGRPLSNSSTSHRCLPLPLLRLRPTLGLVPAHRLALHPRAFLQALPPQHSLRPLLADPLAFRCPAELVDCVGFPPKLL